MSYDSYDLGYDCGYDTDFVSSAQSSIERNFQTKSNIPAYHMVATQAPVKLPVVKNTYNLKDDVNTPGEREDKRGLKVGLVGKLSKKDMFLVQVYDPKSQTSIVRGVNKSIANDMGIPKDQLNWDKVPLAADLQGNPDNKPFFVEYTKTLKNKTQAGSYEYGIGELGLPPTNPADLANESKEKLWARGGAIYRRFEKYGFSHGWIMAARDKSVYGDMSPTKILTDIVPDKDNITQQDKDSAKYGVVDLLVQGQEFSVVDKAKTPAGQSLNMEDGPPLIGYAYHRFGGVEFSDSGNVNPSDYDKVVESYNKVNTWIGSLSKPSVFKKEYEKANSHWENKAKETLAPEFMPKGKKGKPGDLEKTKAGVFLKQNYQASPASYKELIWQYKVGGGGKASISREIEGFLDNPENKKEVDRAVGKDPDVPKEPRFTGKGSKAAKNNFATTKWQTQTNQVYAERNQETAQKNALAVEDRRHVNRTAEIADEDKRTRERSREQDSRQHKFRLEEQEEAHNQRKDENEQTHGHRMSEAGFQFAAKFSEGIMNLFGPILQMIGGGIQEQQRSFELIKQSVFNSLNPPQGPR